jgi:Ca2+-binding EF-hand superfamily protein
MRSEKVVELLKKIEERLFIGKTPHLSMFKKFDVDGDGYITQPDLNKALTKLGI